MEPRRRRTGPAIEIHTDPKRGSQRGNQCREHEKPDLSTPFPVPELLNMISPRVREGSQRNHWHRQESQKGQIRAREKLYNAIGLPLRPVQRKETVYRTHDRHHETTQHTHDQKPHRNPRSAAPAQPRVIRPHDPLREEQVYYED